MKRARIDLPFDVLVGETTINYWLRTASEGTTGLFPMRVKPARFGVYQIRNRSLFQDGWPGYSLWDGQQWHMTCNTPNEAARQTDRSIDCYRRSRVIGWRGLATDPKGAQKELTE